MRRVPLRPIVLVLLAVVLLPGCRRQAPEGEVWFVQATDPHVFIGDEKIDQLRLHQERLDQEAFSAFIDQLDDLPGSGPEPAFLVVSGDFGLDRFSSKKPAAAPASAPPAQQPTGGAAPTATPTPEASPSPSPSPSPSSSPSPSPTPE